MMTPRRYFTARPSTRCYISRHLHSGRGLDAETFGGAQLAGELFLLTSLFIEPEMHDSAERRRESPSITAKKRPGSPEGHIAILERTVSLRSSV
jgi:hypothetical protein